MVLPRTHQAVFDFLEEYNVQNGGASPSIDEVMAAVGKSRSPVQNSLQYLETHGYIEAPRINGKRQARSWRILKPSLFSSRALRDSGIPIRGEIAAGFLSDPLPSHHAELEYLGVSGGDYALRVSGDSMVGDAIVDGDWAIMQAVPDGYEPVRSGEIVAVWVEGRGTTLKHYHRQGELTILRASNPKYADIVLNPTDQFFKVQGRLCDLQRSYESALSRR
jgi:repressor LexA